jgi:hypothetical protein
MNKNTQDCCSLTFKNFYIALAYFYAHFDPRRYSITLSNRIRGVHLVPVWDDTTVRFYDLAGRNRERAVHTIEFIMEEFCNPESRLEPGLLQMLQNYFDVFPVPTPFATLKKEKEEIARHFFFSARECVERAGIKLLEQYLEHRRLDKNFSGECSRCGFGLVLSMNYDDFFPKGGSTMTENSTNEDPMKILILVP